MIRTILTIVLVVISMNPFLASRAIAFEPLNGGTIGELPLNYSAGVFIGNGGDSYTLEFVLIANQLEEILRYHPELRISAAAFSQVSSALRMRSQERVFLNQTEVDAINIPGPYPQIILSQKRWDANRGRCALIYRLVFHELLGLMDYDDSDYKISRRLKAAYLPCHGRRPAKLF